MGQRRAHFWLMAGMGMMVGLSACGSDVTPISMSPDDRAQQGRSERQTSVSMVFQGDDTTISVEDAALVWAIALNPQPAASLSDVVEIANLLLGEPEAIAPTDLTRQPAQSCADLLGPDGVGLEDVAAVLALESFSLSPTEFNGRVQALIPERAFSLVTLPSISQLQQCPRASLTTPTPTPTPSASPSPTISPKLGNLEVGKLRLNRTQYLPGETLTASAIATSARGFDSFDLDIVTVDSSDSPVPNDSLLDAPVTVSPIAVDEKCLPNQTLECSPSVSVSLPDDILTGRYAATLTARDGEGNSGSSSLAFSVVAR